MIPRTWRLLVGLGWFLLLNAQPGKPLDDSVQFSGSLEAVTHHTVSIRLSDGRVVDAGLPDSGELNAQSLFSKYRMGDLVHIAGHVVPVTGNDRDGYFPLRDEETGISRNLNLQQIGFVRKPSSDELAVVLSSRARLVKGNLLVDPARPTEASDFGLKTLTRPVVSAGLPDKQNTNAALERTRTLVHQYLAALPNFVADSKTTLYRSPKLATPKWTVTETLQGEAHFQGGRETLIRMVRNGVTVPDGAVLPSTLRARASTVILSELFSADCPVTIDFEKKSVEGGIPVLVYHFAAPRDSCFGFNWDGSYQRYFAPREGEVFVGEADGLMRQINCVTTGFPNEFVHSRFEERVTWSQVKIGDEFHLLPVSSEFLDVTKGGLSWSVAEYKNHRHFESSSSITFQ